MKYSIFTHVPWPENTDSAKLLTYAADEVRLAEDLGFGHGVRGCEYGGQPPEGYDLWYQDSDQSTSQ